MDGTGRCRHPLARRPESNGMEMQAMVLTPFVEKIQGLREIMRQSRNTVGAHETRTRIVLIDPILRMVGWPVDDPQKVELEYSVGNGRADYALLGRERQPVALIEAKPLGTRLEEHTRQIVAYAMETGVRIAGITDGDRWRLYDVLQPLPMDRKCVMDVSLRREDAVSAALSLLTGLTFERESSDGTETSGSPPDDDGDWTTLARLEEPQTIDDDAEIRFGDGTRWPVRSWQHAVGVVAEWLVTSGRLAEDRLPLQVGDIVRGVHWEPVHSDGTRFNRSHDFDAPSGRHVYVHTHGTHRTSLYYIRCMLESCEVPERNVAIKTG